jgi:hypothetical protein
LLLIDGRLHNWREYYDHEAGRWVEDAGLMRPVPRPDFSPPPIGVPEYSTHQYGAAFLLAALTWPFRDTPWLEPATVFWSGVAVVLAMLAFRFLMLPCYTSDAFTLNAVTLVAFLGTPVWFYGRSLFLEGWLTLCVVGAYGLWLRRNASLLPGILFGLSIQLKPHLAVAALPLFFDATLRRQWPRLFRLAGPMAASVGLLMVLYWRLYGGPLTPPQRFEIGYFWEGFTGLLFSWHAGLFYFCPMVFVAAPCWVVLVRRNGRPAVLVGSGFLLFYLLMAFYRGWDGGTCVGPRHLVPLLPLVLTSLVVLPETRCYRWRVGKVLVWALAAVSVAVNAAVVFAYDQFWNANPFDRMWAMWRGG